MGNYSSLKNIQILVSLLKKYNVKNIVISAGTRHTPLVYSLEHDEFFQTYSVVDERSASFFAIGLIEETHEPAAVCCTSGTAAANYVSAANEAFYQQLPLLILTADRNHYYMFQQEEQMIPQEPLYQAVCKKVVTLPHVRDEKDFWYCSRICNEALMELRHGESGPVHINFIVENNYPIYQGIVKFEEETLPDVKKIDRLTLEDSDEEWIKWSNVLKQSKILIVYGQYKPLSEEEVQNVNTFASKFNCVFSKDLLSNLHCDYSLPTFVLSRGLLTSEFEKIAPDVIITMNANSISEIKNRIGFSKLFKSHWHVSSKGEVSDPFKCLSDVIECSPQTFFKKFSMLADGEAEHTYYDSWMNYYKRFGNDGSLNKVDIPYTSMYGIQQLMNRIPENSLLHIANSNAIRLANYFDVLDSVTVYGNRGAHGIDGSMSAFIGQAHISKRLSFLIIGDLSFFYDMNALWNQYVGNNIRILVCNNSGGAIFHSYPNTNNVETLDEHIAAEHHTSVKDWVVSRGFKYLSATNKKEYDNAIIELMTDVNDKPIVLEMFTDKEDDADSIRKILAPYATKGPMTLKGVVAQALPAGVKEKIKKIIR